jgi:hypothetical protein
MGRRIPLPRLQEAPKRTPSKPIRKPQITTACDSCNIRKVRCGVVRPCAACDRLGFECTQSRLPRDKGPKGCREKTKRKVEELQAASGTQAATSQSRYNNQDYVELDSHVSNRTALSEDNRNASILQLQQPHFSQEAAHHSPVSLPSQDVRLNPTPIPSKMSKQRASYEDDSAPIFDSLPTRAPDDRVTAMEEQIESLKKQAYGYRRLAWISFR